MECPKCNNEVRGGGVFGTDESDKEYFMPNGCIWKVKFYHTEYAKCFVMGDRRAKMYYLGRCQQCGVYFPCGLIRINEVVI